MNNSKYEWTSWLGVLVAVAAITSCRTTPVPADKLARSQALVESAEQAHVEADPRAAVHLQLAKDQLKSATNLMKDGQNRSAEWILRRAEADAEAALALARALGLTANALVLVAQLVGLELEQIGQVLGVGLLTAATTALLLAELYLHFAVQGFGTLEVTQRALLGRQGFARQPPAQELLGWLHGL